MSFFSPLYVAASALEPVVLQLRWHHQFQFAGYYAARDKGFYREAGFDVEIRAGSPQRQPVTELMAGRADFAVGNSEVLLARLKGEPLQAMAVVFQHSPSVLLTLLGSGLDRPESLVGKRVMTAGGLDDVDFLAMFQRQGVDPSQLQVQPSSYDIGSLVRGETDAFNSYLTNEPYFLEQQGLAYFVISPRNYDIDFYSDILFASEKQLSADPARAQRFRDASLRGWKYAMARPEEIIQILKRNYDAVKSTNHLRYEALTVRELVAPELVELGYINPSRTELMADLFVQQGMVKDTSRLSGFVFDPERDRSEFFHRQFIGVSLLAALAILVVVALIYMNRRLQLEVRSRRQIEQQLQRQADCDSLTGLLNRRALARGYRRESQRCLRYGGAFSVILLDLDHFKRINDRYGHGVGDQVLVAVAEVLNGATREVDQCCRFGGEEFLLLLPNTRLQEAKLYAERLLSDIDAISISAAVAGGDSEVVGNERVLVRASLGVAEWSPGDRDEDTINRADRALYQAKGAGRHTVRVLIADGE